MLSPINWIKPRLRSLCIAFGAADMTLVILSAVCWIFFFNAGFEAQHLHVLFEQNNDLTSKVDANGDALDPKYKMKEARTGDELRLQRTIRACGLSIKDKALETQSIDSNYAGPAALIGCSMGSFFTLGALLASLNVLEHPAARRVVCAVALFGESIGCFTLFVGVAILSANDGLCATEYYYEYFQPVLYLFIFTLIFLCTYKSYEMTIIAFYWSDQHAEYKREKNLIKRATGGGKGTLNSDLKKLKLSQDSGGGNEKQGGTTLRRRSKGRSNTSIRNKNNNFEPGGDNNNEEGEKRLPSRDRNPERTGREDSEGRKRRQSGDSNRSRGRAGAVPTSEEGNEQGKRRNSKGSRRRSRGDPAGEQGDEQGQRKSRNRRSRDKNRRGPTTDEEGNEQRNKRPPPVDVRDDRDPRVENESRKRRNSEENGRPPREFGDRRKKRQSAEYSRDWEREAKKANVRQPSFHRVGGAGDDEGGSGRNKKGERAVNDFSYAVRADSAPAEKHSSMDVFK